MKVHWLHGLNDDLLLSSLVEIFCQNCGTKLIFELGKYCYNCGLKQGMYSL